jgi:hypothetical protein
MSKCPTSISIEFLYGGAEKIFPAVRAMIPQEKTTGKIMQRKGLGFFIATRFPLVVIKGEKFPKISQGTAQVPGKLRRIFYN